MKLGIIALLITNANSQIARKREACRIPSVCVNPLLTGLQFCIKLQMPIIG